MTCHVRDAWVVKMKVGGGRTRPRRPLRYFSIFDGLAVGKSTAAPRGCVLPELIVYQFAFGKALSNRQLAPPVESEHRPSSVGHREPERHLVVLGMQQVIGSERDIKQIPGGTRSALWSLFSVPACCKVSRAEVAGPAHPSSGSWKVAGAPLQARPISTRCGGHQQQTFWLMGFRQWA